MKILIALLLMTVTASAQKLGPWGWMLQTNSVFKNASNSFLGNINMNSQSVSNANYINPTNFYANDLPGNTNGPMVLFRAPGSGGISNLWIDTTLGTVSRGLLTWSKLPGDAAYGGFFMVSDHGGGTPDPNLCEMQFSSGADIAISPGAADPLAGHVQFFVNGGAAVGYGGRNHYAFMSQLLNISQANSTGYSGGLTFVTSEAQGANTVGHFPSIFAYSIRTNSPGRYALMVTADSGVGAGAQIWDPNTAKARRIVEFTGGDLTNAIFYKPINYPTNLGTAAIDCSIPVSDQTQAGGTLTFTSPVNFDSTVKQYEHIYMFVTNSAVGALTLAPPTNGRLDGTLTVTRQAQVEWWIKIGFWTNGVVTQWF